MKRAATLRRGGGGGGDGASRTRLQEQEGETRRMNRGVVAGREAVHRGEVQRGTQTLVG